MGESIPGILSASSQSSLLFLQIQKKYKYIWKIKMQIHTCGAYSRSSVTIEQYFILIFFPAANLIHLPIILKLPLIPITRMQLIRVGGRRKFGQNVKNIKFHLYLSLMPPQ